MIRKLKRWWSDNSILFFAKVLISTLRGFFRIRETFAPPEKRAKLRQLREQMESMDHEKNELLRDIDTMHSGDHAQSDAVMDRVHQLGKKYGGESDDSEWQALRAKMRADRTVNDELVAIHESAGEDHEKAIVTFQAYIATHPHSSRAYSWLAGRLTKKGDYDNALAAYETAMRLHSNEATHYITVIAAKNAMAEVLFLQGKTDAAILSFEEAIAAVPEKNSSLKAISFLGLGNLYAKIGSLPKARENWKKAIAHDETGIVKTEVQKQLKELV